MRTDRDTGKWKRGMQAIRFTLGAATLLKIDPSILASTESDSAEEENRRSEMDNILTNRRALAVSSARADVTGENQYATGEACSSYSTTQVTDHHIASTATASMTRSMYRPDSSSLTHSVHIQYITKSMPQAVWAV